MNNQQAINLLKNLEQSLDDYCGLNDEGETAFRMAIAALELFGNAEQLPSAEPEIIRCKDCEYWKAGTVSKICTKGIITSIMNRGDDFCSYAERRTDGRD